MDCWACGHELIWGGDHDLEDEPELSGHSIITNLSCPKCNAFVEVYHGSREKNESSQFLYKILYNSRTRVCDLYKYR